MNKCTFSTSLLVEYLEKKLETPEMPIPEDLAGHALSCPVCARLLAEEAMARVFIAFYRNRQQSAEIAGETSQVPSAVKPGQIWRFFYGPDKQSDFCLITSEPFKGHKNLDLAVRIAPLYLSPNPQELAPSDILLSSKENALGLPLLIEIWNERPMLCGQLMEYQGQISDSRFCTVKSHLNDAIPETLSRTVEIFRRQEIARGSLFSDLTFQRLIEADLAADKVPENEFEPEEHGLKLLYIKLGRLIKTVISPEPNDRFSLREGSPATIYAASENRSNPFIKALYDKLATLLEQDGALPFRVRQSENDSLQLVHTGRRSFLLQVKMTSGSSFTITADQGVCLVKPDYANLPDSETIALIILEEK